MAEEDVLGDDLGPIQGDFVTVSPRPKARCGDPQQQHPPHPVHADPNLRAHHLDRQVIIRNCWLEPQPSIYLPLPSSLPGLQPFLTRSHQG